MLGVVRSYGDRAIAIEGFTQQHYYAPFAHIDHSVNDFLTRPLQPGIVVDFKVDKSNFSGINMYGPRFYATNVRLYQITI